MSEVLLFLLSSIGLVPLAALIGKATEELAYRVGPMAGGLLNASFGNVPELIIGILAIRSGLLSLTRATIMGSVIGNATLVIGMALFYGGVRNGIQSFSLDEVGRYAAFLVLAVSGLLLPTLFDAAAPTRHTETVSACIAILLILSYVAYMLYEIGGFHGGWSRIAGEEAEEETEEAIEELLEIEGGPEWSWQLSVFWLAASTVAVALIGNVLVDSVQPVVHTLGISEFFVGVVIIPIVGNVAEHFAAVQLAGKNKLDLTFAVASGSSVQVAVLIAPLLVLLSFIWHPMTLVFSPIEMAVLSLSVIMFFFVMHDGKTNWLEGVQLMVVYAIAAVVFFFLPSPHLL